MVSGDAERVVVGAGIAGLAAALRLKTAGLDVCLLESARRPGGRVSAVRLGSGPMERGAQFLSAAYTVVPELVSIAGLAGELTPVAAGRLPRGPPRRRVRPRWSP